MPNISRQPGVLNFDAYEVHLPTQEVLKHGLRIKLPPQAFRVLQMLLERPGQLVTREELRQVLWPADTFVDFDQGLNNAIKRIRDVLSDSAEAPRYVETLPRLGYRFVAPVKDVFAETVSTSTRPDGTEGAVQATSFPLTNATSETRTAPNAQLRLRPRWVTALALTGILVAVIGLSLAGMRSRIFDLFRALGRLTSPGHSSAQFNVVPLTALPGQELSPSFSPDGSQVAFSWDGENNGAGFDVYVKAVGADKPLRITNHPASGLGTAWSPDGRYIAVSRDAGKYSGIFLVSPTGGPERKLASANILGDYSYVSWSPDSRQLAFVNLVEGGPGDVLLQVFTISIDEPDPKPLQTDCPRAIAPAFSPGGEVLAFVCIDDFGRSSIRIVNRTDSKIKRVFDGPGDVPGLAWSIDGKSIVFSYSPSGAPSELRRINVSHPDQVEKLPFGRSASNLVIGLAGDRLAYSEASHNVNIWRVALNQGHTHAKPLIRSTREEFLPNISPDGRRITFTSTRTGAPEIWVCDADGTNVIQLTSFGSNSGTPRWSPDGKQILFDSRFGGEANLYLVDANGRAPRKVETGTHSKSLGAWSNNGRSIYFVRDSSTSTPSVWKIEADGGTAWQIAKGPSTYPIASPDGNYVYFIRNVGNQTRVWQVRPDGSDEALVVDMPALRFADEWWPVAGGIYFIGDVGAKQAIEFFDVHTKQIRQIHILEKPPFPWVSGLAISPDDKWILYSQLEDSTSDLMLVENFH